MAPHSSTLAWKIPWTKEPDGLQSMGLLSQTRLKRLSSSSKLLGEADAAGVRIHLRGEDLKKCK